MNELPPLDARSIEQGLVRIARGSQGQRTWQVTARVGDTAEDLDQAYRIAREIELRLRAEDEASRPKK